MNEILIRHALESDYLSVVKLNDAEVEQTSDMDLDRLGYLVSLSSYFTVAVDSSTVIAFLLAMEDGVPYQNDNYKWFSSRYEKFIYIDRVVVDRQFQRSGIGTLLYQNLFSYARQAGKPSITCEINSAPPNEISTAFHTRLGFKEVGSQWISSGQKKVSMQAAQL